MATVLVQGSGDMGSAIAHVLFGKGHRVVLHDTPRPANARRGMAFTDACFDGVSELEGLLAKRVRTLDGLPVMLKCHRAIPVSTEPVETVLAVLKPDVLVDARMRKRSVPASQRGLAPLTIGLGPNFTAGDNVDLAVETEWGEAMGQVLTVGAAQSLRGEPRLIDGVGRERFIYASAAGVFWTDKAIGDAVNQGDCIGRIDDIQVFAPLTGRLRGLSHAGAVIEIGSKIVEVDPRAIPSAWRGLSERPKRIADSIARELTHRLP